MKLSKKWRKGNLPKRRHVRSTKCCEFRIERWGTFFGFGVGWLVTRNPVDNSGAVVVCHNLTFFVETCRAADAAAERHCGGWKS